MEYFTAIEKQSDGSWKYTWDASSGVSYEVWFNGILQDVVEDGEYICIITDYEGVSYDDVPPPLEVIPTTDEPESETYPPFIIMQWKGIEGAAHYQIEEFDGSDSTIRATQAEVGLWYYKFQTHSLEDDEEADWDVTVLDETGTGGTPLDFTKLVVRNPEPPDVDIEYSSSGEVTISEAA